ncbi:MAG: tetratricopeptide repeat protein [Sedimentisphaerales bacterium]|nr:tetratricopeptide repeat protein [Sedimentisphaerales bacterium]
MKYKIKWIISALIVLSAALSTARAETWRLENNGSWQEVSAQNQDRFLMEVAEAKKLVNTGQTKAARKAFERLKKQFPEIAGADLDKYIKAELLLSQRKLTRAARTYDKLLINYPQTKLRTASLERMFAIGTAYLGGQKKRVLWLLDISGNAEGIRVMEKVTDHAGIDSEMGLEAAVAVARNYEKRNKFQEAYLKWWEISLEWQTGTIYRDALLGMAQAKQAIYNDHPEAKRPFYDASCLKSAKSYYEKFQLIYPEEAKELGIEKILEEIYEQLAYKEYIIGRYYQKTGNKTSANLYYNMVVSNSPESAAADLAEDMLDINIKNN